ncbi:hypothetical protein Tco_0628551 [Tanacetum coccineum]|uniref:Uncharacterized protein n=1 Tax=Tanacetum coccineum TaxID=301880 RepID=A0ABQ4WQM8_9ASTR
MTKVIKEEFEKIMDVKVEDVSLTCDTQLEIFNMENDDFEDDDDDMGYDPFDAAFIKWLRGDDEVELTDDESFDDMNEVAERYMIIKYSFNDDEEYVAVKEDEYDDLTVTRKEACQTYQEIFWIMDEGWKNTTTRQSSLSALENMHYSQMIRFDNAKEARKLQSNDQIKAD